MTDQPFSLFEPFADRFCIALFTKEDAVTSDAEAAKQLCFEKVAGLHQVHGNKTVVVNEELNRTEQADGMLTKTPELVLATRWADCQNFVVYAPEKHVAGLLHVGWRGLIAGAIPAFFEALRNNFSIEPAESYVGAGPSLCKQCAGFSNPQNELPGIDSRFFDGNQVDLRSAALQ